MIKLFSSMSAVFAILGFTAIASVPAQAACSKPGFFTNSDGGCTLKGMVHCKGTKTSCPKGTKQCLKRTNGSISCRR
jgi:hypothetical protein